ncbi:hypothetical protein NPX13_g10006 [Xylaria arbuscula]|uniref:Uncharacterized protein n=1 Tax=Xylaria arbuscula TaxID=114810 RepID=A0A9W8N5N5_9PEZI|nr:hypothetical protein NPX13_g10006 [Xylaria arbuscula]
MISLNGSEPSPQPTIAAPWASSLFTTSPTKGPLKVSTGPPHILQCAAALALVAISQDIVGNVPAVPRIGKSVLESNAMENMLTHAFNIDIRTWFANVEQHATEGVNKILIGNKCDWEEKRVVSTEQGEALAKELGIPFLEVSAKSNINIDKAFYNLAADIKKRIIDTAKSDPASSSGVAVGRATTESGGGKCC